MSRFEFIKRDWLRCTVGLLLTISLPFLAGVENPAGAQPLTIFSGLAVMYWAGFVFMMAISDKARAEFFE